MRTIRVQWLVLASALLGFQALMQGCSGCGGDKDKPKVDAGDGGEEPGDGGEEDGGDGGKDGGGQAGTPGIDVKATGTLTTTEGGGQAMFTIALTSRPSANVVIPLSSSDEGEGIVGQSAVTFTRDNWAAPQTVTITGVNDTERDGNVQYEIEIGAAESDDDDYDGMDADDLTVTNLDDDSAGVRVTAAANLQTTEEGGTATFDVVLLSQPSANVVIALMSSDTTEGTVAPAMLTFTTANWASPQTATITGVADEEADGAKAYKIITTATSDDASYNGIEVADVDVTNVDLDTPGFLIEPLTGLHTTEDLGTASFTVRLTTQPSDSVTLALESSDTGEVTIDKPSLTFTRDNWAGLQTVTVTGVNDDIADGDQPFTIRTAQAVSTDSRYAQIDPSDVTGTNGDNDSPGLITVIPGGATTLTTTEDGSPQATFTIRLKSQPTQIVNVVISTDQPGEVSIAPTTVQFSSADWNSLKTVTLTGVNDDAKDGNKPFHIRLDTNSADTAYNELDIPDLLGTNLDNDSAGVRVTGATNLQTRETAPGNTATFTVRLNSKPTNSVAINLESSNTQEVTVSPASLTFTTTNWASPQTVTLTGVDDSVIDGNKTVQITLSAPLTSDTDYAALGSSVVSVSNVDDDSPGLRLSKESVATSETLAQDTFTVALNTQPSADVTVPVVSTRVGEATVSPATLTFTTANWNAPQTVTVSGVNDDVQDGIQTYAVNLGPATSTDANYNGLAPVIVDGTNADNDSAGLQTLNIANLVTGESNSAPQATFEVVLTAQPTAQVDVPVVSLNTAEGTVGPAILHFTTSNWNAPQTVTVTGVDDAVEDGAQDYFIQVGPATSADANYEGKTVQNVQVSNTDNDSAGITVAPLTALEVTEGGEQDTFTLVLNSQPTADVTITVTSSDTGEATVNPGSLTFTTVNWAAPQQVVVTGRGDLLQDGHQAFQVSFAVASSDAKYNGRSVPALDGTNLDIDSPAIRVIIPHELHTDETGGQDSFQVVLLNQPAANVVIPILSGDLTEGAASPASLTFTTANWASPQVVTITGADDDVDDGNQPYFILVGPAMSTDPNYGGRVVPNVPVNNTDDDTAGVTVVATEPLTTTELGGTDTFTIVLNSEPTGNVTFTLTSTDPGEATVAPATITFTNVNWASPQTITVTGVNDAIDDGAQPFLVNIGAPSSSDANYAAQFVPSVTGSNTDDDTAGVTVNAGVLTTSEGGATASFTIKLNSEPTADVIIPVVSGTPTEGLVTVPASGILTFTAANWNVLQTVTITGVDDFVQDGNQPYVIQLGAIQSADLTYTPIVIPDVPVSNTDNDTAGITVSPLGPISTTEAGVSTTFTVVLNSQPTDTVTIALASDDTSEAIVSPAGFTFTTANWNVPQTVTVTGQDDFVSDNDQPFAILIGPAASTDPNYNNRAVPNVNGTNLDNDSPGYVYSTTTVSTYEFEVATTFTVRLTSQPVADVTIALSSSVPTEASVAPAALVFTAANWNVDQTVTVTGVDDASLDGDQPYVIVLGAGVSTDPKYSGLDAASDITGINYEAALSCKEWHTRHPGFGSGQFRLDTDRTGPNPRFIGYCDMVSDGGGFTLLSWTGDSGMGTFGVPYPGRAYCSALNCNRGSAVPFGSLDALFDNSGDLAQGQSTTVGNLVANYQNLEDYEFAGVYTYGSLANLSVEPAGFTGCGGVATGVYNDIIGTAGSDGAVVYLNSGLHRDGDAAFGDFTSESNLYTWSIGARGAYCTLNSTAPASYVGTWDDGQYGPAVLSAAGSYSVWVR